MSLTISKRELRRIAREKRTALAPAQPDHALGLAVFAEDLAIAPGTVVGAYHAHGGEADPALLAARLVKLGAFIAFPRVPAKDAVLDFHLVPDGEVLVPGSFGIPEPLAHWPHVKPQVLLVPLLAFDAHGHRLGYGGGYYDRTLQASKARAIGVAFAGQEVDALPRDVHDYPLDLLVSERGVRRFR